MSINKVFILTEGGKKIGFGHLTRCISLYQAFEENGTIPELIINGDNSTRDLLKNTNYLVFNWLKEKKRLFEIIANTEIVIIDSYLADIHFYRRVADSVKVPAYLDDNMRLNYSKGIVINGSIYARELAYPKRENIVYLLGTKYIPLRKEFRRVSSKQIRKNIQSVMIVFGGNDARNMTQKILKFLARECPKLIKNIIIGKGAGNLKQIAEFKDKKTNLMYYPGVAAMKKLMTEADFAISAGGQTIYELARVGVPTVGMCFAKNQVLNLEGWRKRGFLEYIGWYNGRDLANRLSCALKKIHSQELRLGMSEAGRKYVDGQGARRTAEEIVAYANRN